MKSTPRVTLVACVAALLAAGLLACAVPGSTSSSPPPPPAANCSSLPVIAPDTIPAPQRVFFVNQGVAGASDTNPGTQSQPWLTIQHAADVAQPGDEIDIAAGVYAEAIQFTTSGQPGLPIVFKGIGAAIIDGTNLDDEKLVNWRDPGEDYIVLEGLQIRDGAGWGVWIHGNHNIITDCVVHGSGREATLWPVASGILIEQGDHNQVTSNTVYSNLWNGINVQNANYTDISYNTVYSNVDHMGINVFSDTGQFFGMMSRNNIHHNVIYSNGQSGIYTRYQQCNEISNNLVYGNAQWGIFLHRGGVGGPNLYTANTAIYNNTVVANGYDGIFDAGALSLKIMNNIMSHNDASGPGKAELRIEELDPGDVIDYNLYDPAGDTAAYISGVGNLTFAQFRQLNGGIYEQHGLQADPDFVGRLANNYRLSSASPAINAGTDVSSYQWSGTDLDGTVRPQGSAFDIGAYEFH